MFAKGNEHLSQNEFNQLMAQEVYADVNNAGSDNNNNNDNEVQALNSSEAARAKKWCRTGSDILDMTIVLKVGKSLKGEDFLSLIDKRDKELVTEKGQNCKNDKWCKYVYFSPQFLYN